MPVPKDTATKTFRELEINFYTLYTLTLDVDKWFATSSGCFVPNIYG